MFLFTLLIVEIFLYFIAYKMSNNDFISPTNFSIFIFIFATIFAIAGSNMWKINFSVNSFTYISLGLLMMVVAQAFSLLINKNIKNDDCTKKIGQHIGRIDIKEYKTFIVNVVVLVLTLLYMYDILKSGASIGSNGLAAISAVKYSDSVQTNSILRQGIKVIMAASFIECYVISRNMVFGWKKKDAVHFIPVICAMICSLFTSVRTEALRIIFAFFSLYYLNLKDKNKKSSIDIHIKLFKKFLPIIIVLALVFSGVKNLVKSSDLPINSAFSTIEYISYYIGSPILVFGIKEVKGFNFFKRKLFGEITLNAFWQDLAGMGFISKDYMQILSTNVYISKSDSVTANVDTIFGGLMIDFGLLGMMVFILGLYFILSNIYLRKVKGKPILNNELSYIFYGFLFYLPAMSYYANLFGQYISKYYIITAIFIYCFYIFYFRADLEKGMHIKIKKSSISMYQSM